jgi:hypothetical protein
MLDAGYPVLISQYTGPVATGDTNGDGIFGGNDLVLLVRVVVGMASLSNAQQIAADMDGDNALTMTDVVLIARKVMYG